MPEGVRVIVHPGFHKTGTTSLQSYLGKNRGLFAPYFAFYGKADFLQAGSAARIYAQKPFPWRLRAFRARLDTFLANIPDAPVIVLSRETFSGSMPGHRKIFGRLIKGYQPSAVPLGRQIIAALKARFGPDVRIEFLYTIRAREAWLSSVYGHLLRSIHLTQDEAAFRAQFPRFPHLADAAQQIVNKLPLDAVHVVDLAEVSNRPEGPAAAVLDLIDLPGDLIRPQAVRANVGQSADLRATFLDMNRKGGTKAALKRAKDRLVREARKT
jgi:hypothetical protein